MSAKYDVDDREERKMEFYCTLGQVCPECGCGCKYEFEIPEGKDTPDEIMIVCKHCGRMKAVRDKFTDRWMIPEKDIPFIPHAENNAATLYHRFDRSDYGDEESAISAELELLDILFGEYMGDHERTLELMKRREELIVMAHKAGMDEYEGEYLRIVLQSAEGDEAVRIREEAENRLDTLDLEDLLCLLDSLDINHDEEFMEKVANRMCALLESTKGTPDYFHNVVDVYEAFKVAEMNDRYQKILGDGYRQIKEMVSKGGKCDDLCDYICNDYILSTDDKDELKVAMSILEKLCEPNYRYCEMSVIQYVKVMFLEEDERHHVNTMLNSVIEGLERAIRGGEDEDEAIALAYYMRYLLHRKKSDMMKAADHAITCMSYGDESLMPIIDALLKDPFMDCRSRTKLISRIKSLECDLSD